MLEKQEKIADINLVVDTEIGESDVKFYDVRKAPFEVYGLYNYQNEPVFKRLPDEVAKATSIGVSKFYLNTAGGRVRFSTDSKYVAIKTVMPLMRHMSHMPFTGSAGFDLYEDDPITGESRFCRPFVPDVDATGGYESKSSFGSRKTRYFTIHFPSYSNVSELYIGLQEDATVGEGMKYRNTLPIVFYGSSITQGCASSRPGNIYENVVSRKLKVDYINLGFSGNAKGEDAICDYMASLPMSVFVCDYDHNAPTAEHLRATHRKLYEKVRAKKPDIPYLMITRPDIYQSRKKATDANREVIWDTYRYAREKGDKKVYFLDGASMITGPYADQYTVDLSHPNDLGFALMADAIAEALRQIQFEEDC